MPVVMHMYMVCTYSYKLDWRRNGRKRDIHAQHTHILAHSLTHSHRTKRKKERKKERKIEWDFGTMKSGFCCVSLSLPVCCFCFVYGRWRAHPLIVLIKKIRLWSFFRVDHSKERDRKNIIQSTFTSSFSFLVSIWLNFMPLMGEHTTKQQQKINKLLKIFINEKKEKKRKKKQ